MKPCLLFCLLCLNGYTIIGQGLSKEDSLAEEHQLAVSSINSQILSTDDFDYSLEEYFINALNSKAAGLAITSSSGSPGASSSIRIRGNRSILFENSPLIILDGLPIDNSSFGNSDVGVDYSNRGIDINLYDIETITILKSVHANVIYGIRGANGAILITTKKGRNDSKIKINLNYGLSFDKVNKLPEFQTEYAQGRPVAGALRWRGPDTQEGFSWAPAIADLEFNGQEYPYDQGGMLVPKGTGNGRPANAYDNVGTFFTTGVTNRFNMSVRGGKKRVNYYFSTGMLKQNGIVLNSDFYRRSVRLNINANLTKKLRLGVALNYINSGADNRIQKGANLSGVTLGLFRTSPTFDNANRLMNKEAVNSPEAYQLPDGTQRSYRPGVYDSPYWSINKNPNNTNVNRIITQASLEYNISPAFGLTYKMGVDKWGENELGGFDINSASYKTGFVELNNNENLYINSDFNISYHKNFDNLFEFDALLGQNYFSSSFSNQRDYGDEFIVPGIFELSNTTQQQQELTELAEKILGIYLSVDVSYNDQLFLNMVARNDWSSVLGNNNNSTLYTGAGITWDLARTLDQKDNFDLLLTGSWGKTGNRPGTYLTTTYYSPAFVGGDGFISGIDFPQFGTDGFEANEVAGNAILKPEITKGFETGFDFHVFKNRIGLSYTYFNHQTSDIVLKTPISSNTGATYRYVNAAKINNDGHEIILSVIPFQKAISWIISANFTKLNSMVKELHENVESVLLNGFTSASSRVLVDQPYGVIYGDGFQRNEDGKLVIGSDGWPLNYYNPSSNPYGSESDYKKVLADPNPDWILGIQNTFAYKKISLSMFVDIRQGNEMWNGTAGILNYFGVSQLTADQRNIKDYVFDGVLANSDGEPTAVPNNIPVDFANPADGFSYNKWVRHGFGGLVEESIQDGSWVRLRELALTYQLPNTLLNKVGIENASVSFVGRNLWLSTKYTGIDPETNLTGDSNGFGLEYFNIPNTKSYAFIFNISF